MFRATRALRQFSCLTILVYTMVVEYVYTHGIVGGELSGKESEEHHRVSYVCGSLHPETIYHLYIWTQYISLTAEDGTKHHRVGTICHTHNACDIYQCVRDGLFQGADWQLQVHLVSKLLHQIYGKLYSAVLQTKLRRRSDKHAMNTSTSSH